MASHGNLKSIAYSLGTGTLLSLKRTELAPIYAVPSIFQQGEKRLSHAISPTDIAGPVLLTSSLILDTERKAK